MTNNNEDYQYDSCVSRGICSVNPRTSSLQEVLILYLNNAAYYALKLEENGKTDKAVKNLILNTISVMVSNPEFSENDFQTIIKNFNNELPKLINKYETICKNLGQKPEYIKNQILSNDSENIINSIRLGQQEYQKRLKLINEDIQNLYKIVFILAKSLCTNILDLESYGVEEGYLTILKLLNLLKMDTETDELKKNIIDASIFDNKLMKHLFKSKIERYGKQQSKEISYTTSPGKAILVVGSNIRELEIILEGTKGNDISIYTHDEMILAHTFPKFNEYEHLKGQYGQGMENCLLDFATFPGPIILTRHSLYNVEHLYRGRLYTTDFAYSKGVIPISNYDFTDVINSAESAKGFKTGKICESDTIGFDYDDLLEKIDSKIKNYSNVIIIGQSGYLQEIQNYFDKFLEIIPENTLIISLSNKKQRKNIISVNACYDFFATAKISEEILNRYNLKTAVFFPICNRHTISKMIYLSKWNNTKIFVGKCTPISINPNLILTLTKHFGIKELTTPKKDLEEILTD